MAVLDLSFFFFFLFLWCSMLKAEKQAIICTLYTQHTPLRPLPDLPLAPVCIVPEREGSHSTSQKKETKKPLLCFKRQFVTRRGNQNPKE